MQKFFSRRGSEQQKYRLAFRFVSILIGNISYEYPGSCYRVVLQRGSKKYSSKYFSIIPNKENTISETIQVKATMFFDQQLRVYQEKKFDILIMRKDYMQQCTVAMFEFKAQTCLGYRGQRITLVDSTHKLEAFLVCQRVDGQCNWTNSERSSIDRSIDIQRRTFERRDSSPINNHAVYSHITTIAKPTGSRIITDYRVEDDRKSIIDQVRFDCEPSIIHGELRKSQQRVSPHAIQMAPGQHPPPHMVHFNHPQQGGYPTHSPSHHNIPPQGSRLLMPPSPTRNPPTVPSPSSSQLNYNDPRTAINQNVQRMAQMLIGPQRPSIQPPLVQPQNVSAPRPAPAFNSVPAQLPKPQNKQPPQQPSQQPIQPPRISVSTPDQTQFQIQVEKSTSQLSILSQQPKSKSPSFRDLINVEGEKLPVRKKIFRKDRSERRETMVTQTSQNQAIKEHDTTTNMILKELENDKTEEVIVNIVQTKIQERENIPEGRNSLPSEIIVVDSMVKTRQQVEDIIVEQPKQEEVFRSATFKNSGFNQNMSFEDAPKRIQREFQSQRSEVCQIKQLQLEKDKAYETELILLNQKLENQSKKLQQQISLREDYIREKQNIIEQLKQQLQTLSYEKKQIEDKCHDLQAKNAFMQGNNRNTIFQYDEKITNQNKQLAQFTSNVQLKLADALQTIKLLESQNRKLIENTNSLNVQNAQILRQNAQLASQVAELKQLNSKIGHQNTNLGELHNQFNTKIAQLTIRNSQLNNYVQTLSGQISNLQKAEPNPQMQKLVSQIERISVYNRNSIGEIQQLRAQKDFLASKQTQLLQKYVKNFNELNEQKNYRQSIEQKTINIQTKLQLIIKARDEEIAGLHQHIKQMEFNMVDPDEDPNYIQTKIKVGDFQKQIKQLNLRIVQLKQQNRNELNAKNKEVNEITQKLNQTQKLLNETVAIWTLKEKTLSQSIVAKERKIAELEKPNTRQASNSETTVKNGNDSDRRQLLMKIQELTGELQRLEELDQEIAVVEAMNKDLETQIAHANKKMAFVLQYVYQKNPKLAQELARLKIDAQ